MFTVVFCCDLPKQLESLPDLGVLDLVISNSKIPNLVLYMLLQELYCRNDHLYQAAGQK